MKINFDLFVEPINQKLAEKAFCEQLLNYNKFSIEMM